MEITQLKSREEELSSNKEELLEIVEQFYRKLRIELFQHLTTQYLLNGMTL